MSHASRRLTPYEELKIESCGNSVAVQTPWLVLECEFVQAVTSIRRNVLASLYHYPICYIHPRQTSWRDVAVSLRTLWRELWRTNLPEGSVLGAEENSSLRDCGNTPWNLDEAVRFSRIGWLNMCDSVAAFSFLRRHLQQALMTTPESKLFDRLDALKSQGEVLCKGVSVVLAQNLHLTRYGTEALNTAISLFPSISGKVTAYIESEKGHDKLVLKSLKLLGYENPSELELLPETKKLVQILKVASSSSAFALALLIEFFEAGSSSARHPIACLLEGTVHAHAGKPLQKHRDINVSAGHSSTALNFLIDSEPVSIREVHEASRLLSLAICVRRAMLERLDHNLQRLSETST